MNNQMVNIRKAKVTDREVIVDFVKQLAVYEKLEKYVKVTPEDIKKSLFGENPKVFSLIAEVDNKPAGFALYFFNFSTFMGKHGIYLEDFFVDPEFRSQKVGFKLFKSLAKIAIENDCARIDWAVLDWNQLAIDFYQRIGAKEQTEWTGYRLDGVALKQLSEM